MLNSHFHSNRQSCSHRISIRLAHSILHQICETSILVCLKSDSNDKILVIDWLACSMADITVHLTLLSKAKWQHELILSGSFDKANSHTYKPRLQIKIVYNVLVIPFSLGLLRLRLHKTICLCSASAHVWSGSACHKDIHPICSLRVWVVPTLQLGFWLRGVQPWSDTWQLLSLDVSLNWMHRRRAPTVPLVLDWSPVVATSDQ